LTRNGPLGRTQRFRELLNRNRRVDAGAAREAVWTPANSYEENRIVKKRLIYIATGALALSLGVYVTSMLWAQGPAQPPTQNVPTRIGILNMTYVIKSYQKIEAYTAEMKDQMKRCDDAIKAKTAEIEVRGKQAQDASLTQAQREACAKEVTKLTRELEDMKADMKKNVQGKTDEQMVTIYREIQEAASRYALGHNLDMVMTYIDAVKEEDYFNPMNVMAKIQQRAFMPIYFDKSMDVSKPVVDMLNQNYKGAQVTPTSAH
jgi:Skp family chaperone for outer membrane proteins